MPNQHHPLTAEQVIELLGLRPLPIEGGYFVETDRAGELPAALIADSHPGARSRATAIYYFLASGMISAMHRLPGPEIYHHYLGDPVELLLLEPDGTGRLVILGNDLRAGQRPQLKVPGGIWQGSILLPGSFGYALMGTTMSPGFDPTDHEHADQGALTAAYPAFAAAIAARSHPPDTAS